MICHTFKAAPIGREATEGGTPLVEMRPMDGIGFFEQRELFRQEASNVCDFMDHTMPQGLVDHICAELCLRKASLFHVLKESEPTGNLDKNDPTARDD